MKLHHLLQKCSFFLIKLAAFLASGAACMKLQSFLFDLTGRFFGQRRRLYETSKFLIRFDRTFFFPAAGLTPETYINYQRACCHLGAPYQAQSRKKHRPLLVIQIKRRYL
jgi:hypothetical protein